MTQEGGLTAKQQLLTYSFTLKYKANTRATIDC